MKEKVTSWIKADSLKELLANEEAIIEKINNIPNGPNLFMANPFSILAEIGVELSNQARKEIITLEPWLAAVSDTAYQALKASKRPQKVRYHLKGLFRREKQ